MRWLGKRRICFSAYAQPAIKFWQFFYGHPTESESTMKRFYRWLSQRRNVPEINFTGPVQSSYCIQQASLSSELGIYELLTASIQSFLARSNCIWVTSYMPIAMLKASRIQASYNAHLALHQSFLSSFQCTVSPSQLIVDSHSSLRSLPFPVNHSQLSSPHLSYLQTLIIV